MSKIKKRILCFLSVIALVLSASPLSEMVNSGITAFASYESVIAQKNNFNLSWGTENYVVFTLSSCTSARIEVQASAGNLKLSVDPGYSVLTERTGVYGSYTYNFTTSNMQAFSAIHKLIIQGQGSVQSLKIIGISDTDLSPAEIVGEPEYVSTNLTLKGVIGANVYYTVPEGYINNLYKVETIFTAKGLDDVKVRLSPSKYKMINGKKAYMFTLPVISCNMAKRYKAKLVVTNVDTNEAVFTTASSTLVLYNYISSLASTGTAEEKAFAKTMQTYGYRAQQSYNTTDTLPVITPIDTSDVTANTLRRYASKTVTLDGDEHGSIYGTTLILGSSTNIRSYITDFYSVNINNIFLRYTVNGKSRKVKIVHSASDNSYYADIQNIPANRLGTTYSICFTEGDTPITDTIQYSAYSYFYATLKSTSATEQEKNLAKAMYKYSEAAQQIIGQTDYDPMIDDIPVPDNAIDFAQVMQAGWNLGNSLDADATNDMNSETSWGQPKVTKALIKYVRSLGFKTIRIPVSWGNHTNSSYQIDSNWMKRVKEVVNYAYDLGFYVIIDSHHDCEFYYPSNANFDNASTYIQTIWTQIAAAFKSYDERLIFEGMNEPRLMDTIREWWFKPNDTKGLESIKCIVRLNQIFVDTVRSGDEFNKTRFLLVPSNAASPENTLNSAFTMPTDTIENRLFVSIHGYTPNNFTMQINGTSEWDDSMKEDLLFMNMAYNKFIRHGYGIIIGEVGAMNKNNLSDRIAWAKAYYGKAANMGLPCVLWDNNTISGDGEKFGMVNRQSLSLYYPTLLQEMFDAYK